MKYDCEFYTLFSAMIIVDNTTEVCGHHYFSIASFLRCRDFGICFADLECNILFISLCIIIFNGIHYLRETQTHNFCLVLSKLCSAVILSPINTTGLKLRTSQSCLHTSMCAVGVLCLLSSLNCTSSTKCQSRLMSSCLKSENLRWP